MDRHVERGEGERRIWLKQLVSGAEVAITSGADDFPRFAPDGGTVLFTRRDRDGFALYRVPTLGGEPRRVIENAQRGDWSPDGKNLAYLRPIPGGKRVGFELHVASSDGSGDRLLTREEGSVVGPPRFAPDGRTIVFSSGNGTFGNPWTFVVVAVDGGGRTTHRPPSETGQLTTDEMTLMEKKPILGGHLVHAQHHAMVKLAHA